MTLVAFETTYGDLTDRENACWSQAYTNFRREP